MLRPNSCKSASRMHHRWNSSRRAHAQASRLRARRKSRVASPCWPRDNVSLRCASMCCVDSMRRSSIWLWISPRFGWSPMWTPLRSFGSSTCTTPTGSRIPTSRCMGSGELLRICSRRPATPDHTACPRCTYPPAVRDFDLISRTLFSSSSLIAASMRLTHGVRRSIANALNGGAYRHEPRAERCPKRLLHSSRRWVTGSPHPRAGTPPPVAKHWEPGSPDLCRYAVK